MLIVAVMCFVDVMDSPPSIVLLHLTSEQTIAIHQTLSDVTYDFCEIIRFCAFMKRTRMCELISTCNPKLWL
jgi:hypothetical protein